MLDNLSFIATYDNTENCKVEFVTESVTDLLGWQPDEFVGKPAYNLCDPKEIPVLHQVHQANVMNEKLSTMISYRFQHKDGSFVKLQTLVHYAFDHIVSINWIHDVDSLGYKQRLNSVDESFNVTDTGELELTSMGSFPWRPNDMKESMQNSLMVSRYWKKEMIQHEQEPRFHIILNRYSELMTIAYVSSGVTGLLGVLPVDIIGKSIFDVVYARDRPVVDAQCSATKSHYVSARIRFDWLIDADQDLRQPVDSVVSGSTDGLVLVVRLARKPVQLS
ncbi:hypothetical protein BCR42DRAFT_421593 [Absidia repens]|uniref:PAS domain-containing protein n=1 Tax=Absidia repens TaxID=90262 RepID=A0A1X2I7M6_9FUNG|nr:hypothetical protein BCR42DRAFT_421593 [Absidia repens]